MIDSPAPLSRRLREWLVSLVVLAIVARALWSFLQPLLGFAVAALVLGGVAWLIFRRPRPSR